jgi:hypothetical protein
LSGGALGLSPSTAIPFPFPTSVFYAAAGASGHHIGKYLAVVGICRAMRYSLLAILADHYGRHFIPIIQHPVQYWGWLLLFAAIVTGLVATGIVINRRLETTSSAG